MISNRVRRFSVLPVLIAMSGWNLCCLDEPPAVPDTPITKAKRDYVWSIDSVNYGSLPGRIEMESMWGSSPTDVWGVSGDAFDVRDCMWHYNGYRWSRATAGTPITEFTGNKTVYAVWGSAANDVWAVGRKVRSGVLSAFLMHYDGVRWVDATPPHIAALQSVLYNIHGESASNIWVGGYEYALAYNGAGWRAFKVADSMTVNGIGGSDGRTFFQVASPWGRQEIFYYRFNPVDSSFSMVDRSTIYASKFGAQPWITGHTLYTISAGIRRTSLSEAGQIDTSGWKEAYQTASYLTARYVIDPRNVFCVGQYNLILHFNGQGWKQLSPSIPGRTIDPYNRYWGVWGNGEEVFICDVQNGLVYHGR